MIRLQLLTGMRPGEVIQMTMRAIEMIGRSEPGGAMYTVASYRRAIARACLEAGIPVWNPHGLRHTAASEIRRSSGRKTRLILGHSKIDTTRLYGEVDQVKASEAMGKIG